jgi:hypothetical protein
MNILQWKESAYTTEFYGTTYEIKYNWRDPMKHAEEMVGDPTLAEYSHFHAERKYLHRNNKVSEMWDEPWTGREWWDREV